MYALFHGGAPGVNASKRGYCYSDTAFVLPVHFISEGDRKILKYLAERYSSIGRGNAEQIAHLFARLTDNTDKDTDTDDDRNNIDQFEIELNDDKKQIQQLMALDVSKETIDNYYTLKGAMEKECKVSIHYLDAQYCKSNRVFCPYKFFIRNGLNYLVGFCQLREEIRTLRLDRIKGISLLEERFEIVSYFKPKNYGETPFDWRDPYQAILSIRDLNPADKLDYPLKKLDNEQGKYRVAFYDSKELLEALVSKLNNFTIISPTWLKEKLIKRLELLLNNHK